MNEVELLTTRLQQTFIKAVRHGPALAEGSFHGPSLMESLEGVGFIEADRRVIQGRHTIWEIVNHCAYWMEESTKALQGHGMRDVDQYEDWPINGSSEEDWIIDNKKLVDSYQNLRDEILEIDYNKLDEVIDSIFYGATFQFTLRKMLYGIIDHNLYHAGQISMLRNS